MVDENDRGALARFAAVHLVLGELLRNNPERAAIMRRLRQHEARYASVRHPISGALDELESQ